jgi:AraC-like DNA-binding protein
MRLQNKINSKNTKLCNEAINMLRSGTRNSEVARVLGFNSHQAFSYSFERYTGKLPSEYSYFPVNRENAEKCNEAIDMLKSGINGYEVGSRLGFNSQGAFSRLFKGYVGVNPVRYSRKK